jgi:hypothetical protein
MLTANRAESYVQLPHPLLSVYLNTRQAESSRHPLIPESFIWLKKEAKWAAHGLAPAEQALLQQQLERILEFLDNRPPNERSLVIFAGPKTWEVLPLQVSVENELHWGKPAIAQLLWLAEEHKPYCVTVLDHKGAAFFQYQLRELLKIGEKKFDVDISEWKKKDLGHFSGEEVRKTRGSQRDVFEHRMDSQYEHLCTETANQTMALSKEHKCAAILVIGEDRLSRPIKDAVPQEMRPKMILIEEDFAWMTERELEQRLEPIIEDWERKQQAELVNEFLASERGTVSGIEETLSQLQRGSIRTVLLPRDLEVDLKQCLKCGWTERSADPVCSACGGERRTVTLREILPGLAKTHKAEIQVVSGETSEALKKGGTMGAWLRGAKLALAR